LSVIKLKQKLVENLAGAIRQAQQQGKLPQVAVPEITLEKPQNPAHGDYATSLPLKLARACSMNPMLIARSLSEYLEAAPELSSVATALPGFLNFTCSPAWLTSQVEAILAAGGSYGEITLGTGHPVQVEFVSANPTGPLHVGHGRGAVLGSTLAAVLAAAGYDVQKEYYVNDAGSQMQAFYSSLWARYQQALGRDAAMPESGYFGHYMTDLAQDIAAECGGRFLDAPGGREELGKLGLEKMLAVIKRDLETLRVSYDCWFSEQSLYDSGEFQQVLDKLRRDGYLVEKEGATWFTSTAPGDDKDNVVIRSDGTSTYFGTDIAYHYNKFAGRGFERVIDIWGADHQGHVPRMKAVVTALGIDPGRLHIIISQLVTLRRGGECVKLSKRSGEMITLGDVIDEVGVDACRFFFLARSADSQMDFDLELAKKESSENPVYYVQYAHARIASILRLAAEEGIDYSGGDVSLLTSEAELALIRQMLRLPEIIELAAKNLEPQHLPYYAQELATAFHSFYKQCRVVSKENAALTAARLKLVAAARTVLARTLHLMGMNAPEKM
jgi:arginyl-tRNA synthetase